MVQLSEASITTIRERAEGRFFLKSVRNFFKLYWRYLFGYLWPIFNLWVFAMGTNKKIRCLYILLVMYGYWTFDVLPEGITSLIPIFALPMLMVQHIYTTCTIYFQYGFFVVNAVLLGICLEHTGVFERFTLFVMVKFGGSPRAIHTAISTICALVSIRIANTYSVVLMIPIIDKILEEIDMEKIETSGINLRVSTVNFRSSDKITPVNLSLAFYTGVIYASDFGGFNFITGSITNFAFTATYQRRYPNCGIPQTPWYMYTIPVAIVAHTLSILWVQILYLGLFRSDKKVLSQYKLLCDIFKEQKIVHNLHSRLGKITLSEICVGIAYACYVFLWYIDDFLYFLYGREYYLLMFITDSTAFFCITFGLMLLPSKLDFLKVCHRDRTKRKMPSTTSPSIMSWGILQEKIPWNRVLLLGSIAAMSQAQFSTGLAKDMASQLSFMKNWSYWALLFVVTLFANIMTETCSNGIICGVFSPLVIELAILSKVHPVHLGLPFAVVCSFGMVTRFASLNVKKIIDTAGISWKDMFRAGIFPKITGWLLIFGTFDAYGKIIFHENAVFPKNFLDLNETCFCKPCPFMKYVNKTRNW